jgi:hypothetical protein
MRRETGSALLALLCVSAALALLLAPPATAQTDPVNDRITTVLDRVQGQQQARVGPARAAALLRAAPPFVCQLLAVRMPAPVRNLLRSLGVGPCVSA